MEAKADGEHPGTSTHSITNEEGRNQEILRRSPLPYEILNSGQNVFLSKPGDSKPMPPDTDGESRIMLASDGAKQCLTILLTEDIVSDFNRLVHSSRAVAKKQRIAGNAEAEANSLEDRVDTLINVTLAQVESQEERDKVQVEIEQVQSELRVAEKRRDSRKEEVENFRDGFDTSVGFLQTTLEQLFREAGLLDPPDDDSESTACSVEDTEQISTALDHQESIEPNAEELLRTAAKGDLQQSQWKLTNAQINFDRRQAKYSRNLGGFRTLEAEGNLNNTRTEFDRRQIIHGQKLTRDLINAEESYEKALRQAEAVGQPHQPENDGADIFHNDQSIPHNESHQADKMPTADRGRIEEWSLSLRDLHDPEMLANEQLEIEDWHVRPVETSDSISVVDF